METTRPYISHSQFILFNSSPKAYYEKYVLGKETPSTKYQRYGKKLMVDLEFDEEGKMPKALKRIVNSGIVEKEITATSKFINKDLFGIIDVIAINNQSFTEIKTGKHPWDNDKVMKDTQMLFYALMINLKYAIIPRATLVWAETKDTDDGTVEFTGRVKEFKRTFTLEELLKFQKRVELCVFEIAEYEHSILEVEIDRDEKLLELLTEKKRIDDELDLLKAEIMLDLREFSNKYAESENFNITLASRKKWKYSADFDLASRKSKGILNNIKLDEELKGKATFTTTEYLLIKPKK